MVFTTMTSRSRRTCTNALMRMLGVCVIATGSGEVRAATCTAATDGDWDAPSTWSNCGGNTPGATDTARISNPRQVVIPDGVAVTVGAIEFGASGTTQSLTVSGSLLVGDVTHTTATINGVGPITVTGTYDWIGNGPLNGGLEGDGSGAQLTFAPGSQWNLLAPVMNLRQRDVVLQGNALWSAGNIGCSNVVTLLIAAAATVEITHAGDIGSGGVDCRIRNEGNLRKSGAGTVRLTDPRVRLENHGLLEVLQGGFDFFNAGGETTHSGIFRTSAGATLTAPRTAVFASGSRFEGVGVLAFTGSGSRTFEVDQDFAGPVQLDGQTSELHALEGVTLRFDAGLQWRAGRILGPGTFRVPDGTTLVLDGASPKTVGTRAQLSIEGDAQWLGGILALPSSGTPRTRLTIAPGASFDVGFRPASIDMGGGDALLENEGSFVAIEGEGLMQLGGAAGADVVNRGSMHLAGAVRIDLDLVQESGLLRLDDAQLAVENFAGNPRPLQLQGGTLAGTGTLRALLQNSGGLVAPGDIGTIGRLALTGSYTQGAAAGLAIDVAGATSGSFDELLIEPTPGSAQLAGTLVVDRIGGFQFALGDLLPILLASSRSGSFDAVILDADFDPPPLVLLQPDAVLLGLQTRVFADGFEATP